jgi:NADPH-dependent 2,4-dienoyl-CoA reductase/sulfur reductase-like enzyme
MDGPSVIFIVIPLVLAGAAAAPINVVVVGGGPTGVETAGALTSMARELGLEVNDHGRIVVDSRLQVRDHPDVFAVGDVAATVPDRTPAPVPPGADTVRSAVGATGNHVGDEPLRPTAAGHNRSRQAEEIMMTLHTLDSFANSASNCVSARSGTAALLGP